MIMMIIHKINDNDNDIRSYGSRKPRRPMKPRHNHHLDMCMKLHLDISIELSACLSSVHPNSKSFPAFHVASKDYSFIPRTC